MIESGHARPIEILLAEDSSEDAALTTIAMSENKLTNSVHLVDDGVEALKFLRRESPYEFAVRPDLIILDLNMPRKNGLETLHEIRSDPRFADVPIAILTTSKAEQEIIESYDLSTSCIVPKPLTTPQFVEIVKSIDRFGISILKPQELA